MVWFVAILHADHHAYWILFILYSFSNVMEEVGILSHSISIADIARKVLPHSVIRYVIRQ